MTPTETFDLAMAIAATVDEHHGQPDDVMRLCGYLLTKTLCLLPKKERPQALRDWVKYAQFVLELSDPIEGEPGYVSRH